MAETLERIFRVLPAYDCIGVQPCVHGSERCIPGTGGSHGRKSAEMHLTVRGPDAEITLVISTGWDLPTVPAYHRGREPRGAFVEFHTARPRYEGQDRGEARPDGTCRDWAACYLDTGYTMSDEPTALLIAEGSDAVWAWLENLYDETQVEMDKLAKRDMTESVYVVVGHIHYGGSRTVGVYADEAAARARCAVANRDPRLYLSGCDVYVWELGADQYTDRFSVYPSLEDAQAMFRDRAAL